MKLESDRKTACIISELIKSSYISRNEDHRRKMDINIGNLPYYSDIDHVHTAQNQNKNQVLNIKRSYKRSRRFQRWQTILTCILIGGIQVSITQCTCHCSWYFISSKWEEMGIIFHNVPCKSLTSITNLIKPFKVILFISYRQGNCVVSLISKGGVTRSNFWSKLQSSLMKFVFRCFPIRSTADWNHIQKCFA